MWLNFNAFSNFIFLNVAEEYICFEWNQFPISWFELVFWCNDLLFFIFFVVCSNKGSYHIFIFVIIQATIYIYIYIYVYVYIYAYMCIDIDTFCIFSYLLISTIIFPQICIFQLYEHCFSIFFQVWIYSYPHFVDLPRSPSDNSYGSSVRM